MAIRDMTPMEALEITMVGATCAASRRDKPGDAITCMSPDNPIRKALAQLTSDEMAKYRFEKWWIERRP